MTKVRSFRLLTHGRVLLDKPVSIKTIQQWPKAKQVGTSGTTVKMLLEMPTSRIAVPGFEFHLFWSSCLLMPTMWVKSDGSTTHLQGPNGIQAPVIGLTQSWLRGVSGKWTSQFKLTLSLSLSEINKNKLWQYSACSPVQNVTELKFQLHRWTPWRGRDTWNLEYIS